jgi:hypothetical protein
MWADALFEAERGHLIRLLVWGAASVLVGTAVLAAARNARRGLAWQFGLQTAAWGAIDLGLVAWGWGRVTFRDLAGYTALDRFLWLNVGLDAGYVGVGLTLALTGWFLGRRPGPIGAGMGVVVQGLALLVLDAWFLMILDGLQRA